MLKFTNIILGNQTQGQSIYNRLAWPLFSAFKSPWKMPRKNSYGSYRRNSCHANVANSAILLLGDGKVSSLPILYPRTLDLFRLPCSPNSQHPLLPKPQLPVCKLSADHLKVRAFMESQQTWRTGTQKRYTTHINKWLKFCAW